MNSKPPYSAEKNTTQFAQSPLTPESQMPFGASPLELIKGIIPGNPENDLKIADALKNSLTKVEALRRHINAETDEKINIIKHEKYDELFKKIDIIINHLTQNEEMKNSHKENARLLQGDELSERDITLEEIKKICKDSNIMEVYEKALNIHRKYLPILLRQLKESQDRQQNIEKRLNYMKGGMNAPKKGASDMEYVKYYEYMAHEASKRFKHFRNEIVGLNINSVKAKINNLLIKSTQSQMMAYVELIKTKNKRLPDNIRKSAQQQANILLKESQRYENEAKRLSNTGYDDEAAEREREEYEAQQAREAYEAQQAREGYEAQRAREAYEAQRAREAYEAQQAREAYEAQQAREAYEAQQAREAYEAQRAREAANAAQRAREAANAEQAREAEKAAQRAREAANAEEAREAANKQAREAANAEEAREAENAAQRARKDANAQRAREAANAEEAREAENAAQQARKDANAEQAREATPEPPAPVEITVEKTKMMEPPVKLPDTQVISTPSAPTHTPNTPNANRKRGNSSNSVSYSNITMILSNMQDSYMNSMEKLIEIYFNANIFKGIITPKDYELFKLYFPKINPIRRGIETVYKTVLGLYKKKKLDDNYPLFLKDGIIFLMGQSIIFLAEFPQIKEGVSLPTSLSPNNNPYKDTNSVYFIIFIVNEYINAVYNKTKSIVGGLRNIRKRITRRAYKGKALKKIKIRNLRDRTRKNGRS